MNNLERGLLIVLAYFFGVSLLIYVCFKIYEYVTSRKSRNYRNVLPEGQGVLEMRGDYVLVNAPPIKPNYFARSYKYKSHEYQPSEQDDQSKCEEQPPDSVLSAVKKIEALPKTTSV